MPRTAAVAAEDGRQKFQRPSLAGQARNFRHPVPAFGADSGPSSGGEPDLLGSNPDHWALSQPAPGHAALCIVQYAVIEACQLAGGLIDGKTSSRSIVASGLPRRISQTTRLIPRTRLMIWLDTADNSHAQQVRRTHAYEVLCCIVGRSSPRSKIRR